jgi:hypothetical protein
MQQTVESIHQQVSAVSRSEALTSKNFSQQTGKHRVNKASLVNPLPVLTHSGLQLIFVSIPMLARAKLTSLPLRFLLAKH